ncbi:MAG: hypothetical protein JWN62_4643 [Acidimicrobiales bacterium]|nr:hypothetical protein [Acidimicrobiales bacterium]
MLNVTMAADRTVVSVDAQPGDPNLARLIGARAGSGFRRAVIAAAPAASSRWSAGYLLLDDLAGVSLIGSFAWTRQPGFVDSPRRSIDPEGICSAYRDGGQALIRHRNNLPRAQNAALAPSLLDPTDIVAWHHIDTPKSVCMRRRRRIDVWFDSMIHMDAIFRDNTWDEDGREIVVHEYELTATADLDAARVTAVRATARVLPYRECPLAAGELHRLLGSSLKGLRTHVIETLRGIESCTHLNDMLRAMADVPMLIEGLARSGDI